MNYINNATLIKRELMVRLAKSINSDDIESINRIPLEMAPKNGTAVRCCVYKDRAVLKYRLMALLGHSIEDETDELKPISVYARESFNREECTAPILTVMDEACSSCVKNNYFVTNACQGCVARPCIMNCPKNAITMVNDHAVIDPEKCVNCGKCMNECPYHAIIYMPVPCEEACPVNAISKNEHGKEQIDFDKCISCGKCLRECPFGAIMERSQMVDVLKSLKSDRPVAALVAPALVGQFSSEWGQIISAIKKLGFDDVYEVAFGADLTVEHEAQELKERLQAGEKFMTTSCCPAYVEAVKKHIPKLEPFVSQTPSPMQLTAKHVREQTPDAVQVFISPCVAKRSEALKNSGIDYVLSIEELGALFVAFDIDVQKCNESEAQQTGSNDGRGFPVSGGVTRAIEHFAPDTLKDPILIDGLNSKTMRELKRLPQGFTGNFVEVMACEGGCLAGPNVICSPRLSLKNLNKLLTREEKKETAEMMV